MCPIIQSKAIYPEETWMLLIFLIVRQGYINLRNQVLFLVLLPRKQPNLCMDINNLMKSRSSRAVEVYNILLMILEACPQYKSQVQHSRIHWKLDYQDYLDIVNFCMGKRQMEKQLICRSSFPTCQKSYVNTVTIVD